MNLPYPELNNEEDGYALYIKFRGRDWIIIYKGIGDFVAVPADQKQTKKQEAENVINYIIKEGFIDEDGLQMSVQ